MPTPTAAELDRRQAEAAAAVQARNHEIAAELAGKVTQHDPNRASAWHMLGMARHGLRQSAVGVECLRRAVALEPGNVIYHTHLAEVCRATGLLDEAIAAGREAVRLDAKQAAAHNNLGLALLAQEKFSESEAAFRAAVDVQPDYARGHYNLAHALARQERADETLRSVQRALQLQPDYPQALHLLGSLLHEQRRSVEALEYVERAVQLKPRYPAALVTRGRILQALRRLDAALASFREALTIEPDNLDALGGAATLAGELCDWRDFTATRERLLQATLARLAAGKSTPISVSQIARFPLSAAEQLAVARQASRDLQRRIAPIAKQRNYTHALHDRPRIRLGYLSGDFRNHATSHLMQSLFGLHDRGQFEVRAYSFGPDDGSEYRRRIAADCDAFIDIAELSPADAARRIHADGTDILIDLMGYAGNARPEIVALRSAPIQVNYLGFPGSMGADFIDYMIVDRIVAPPSDAAHFSEALAYLPNTYQCTDDRQPIAEKPPTRRGEGLPETGFVFASFNANWKIDPAMFDVWMRILAAVPGSVLWLLADNEHAPKNLRSEATARGVDPSRLVFARICSKAEHLARQRLADLFLDTTLCNAHTTATDALWAGLPVLTCRGQTFATRVAASLLTAVGLPELIPSDLGEYERLAVRFASSPADLTAIRANLAANRTTQPLFDTRRFVHNLEQAYHGMWQRRKAGQPPATIEISDPT